MTLKNRIAFTLIELLVVIMIIGVLIGILLPALGAARRSGNITQCVTNVRSIVQAIEFYLNEEREIYPTGSLDNAASTSATEISVFRHNIVGKDGDPQLDGGTGPAAGSSGKGRRIVNRFLAGGGKNFDANEKTAHCPLDAGFKNDDARLAFDVVGSSYYFPNRMVGATSSALYDIWAVEGHRDSEVAVPQKKLIIADLPIMGDRGKKKPENRWHDSVNNKHPAVSIGFGDGHAEGMNRKSGGGGSTDGSGNTVLIDLWAKNHPYY